jgi:acetyl esterase/lipase
MHPEHRTALAAVERAFPDDYAEMDVVARRAASEAILREVLPEVVPLDTVTWEDHLLPGESEESLLVRVYRPSGVETPLPAIYYIHGGGMWAGTIDFEHANAVRLSETLGCVVTCVEYRLAPENPYPAPLDDCVLGYTWLTANCDALGIDSGRIVIFGMSAGGGLAFGTALRVRDDRGHLPALVATVAPMLDDRHATASVREFDRLGPLLWDGEKNREGWSWYLGGRSADEYAAPARAAGVTGMPPAFIDVGELDPFRDEDILFATRLLQAGVPTELHVYPGLAHGVEGMAPGSDLSQTIERARLEALRRAFRSPKGG